jgi:hypothetical protein
MPTKIYEAMNNQHILFEESDNNSPFIQKKLEILSF